VIRPAFIEQAARDETLPPIRVSQVLSSDTFKQLEARACFSG
jgi:hypothetical protein